MGFAAAAPQAIAIGSELYKGFKGQQAQGKNNKAQQDQFNMIQQMLQGQMGKMGTPGAAESGLQGFINQMKGPQQIDLNTLGIQDPSQNKGFNAGQDALMQMINRDPSQQLGVAGEQLTKFAQNGGQQDVEALLAAMNENQMGALDSQVAQARGRVSGLGQRGGTANALAAGQLRSSALGDMNQLNAQVRMNAMDTAKNRQLQAATALGGMNLQGFGQQLNAVGQLGQYANMGQNFGAQNAQTRLAALQANQQAGLQFGNQQLGAYGQLGGMEQGRNGQMQALMAMLSGQQAPQMSGATPFADSLSTASLLPMLFSRLNKKPTTTVSKAG